ncbi:MAG: NAD(P)/FAD-dependent oxidoreductase [Acidimicrobiales bacterium]
MGPQPEVVIVGAGFGGLAAGRALAAAPVGVTILDAHNYHTFQPLLYQVATAGLGPDDIAQAVRGIFQRHPRVRFRLGRACGIDLGSRRLRLDGGGALPYDFLVIAAGATTAYPPVPGVEEHALAVKTLEEAVRLRSHVLARFEQAAACPALVDEGILTVVIVGGGTTGVELAGAMSELFSMVLARDFTHLDVGRAKVVLVEQTDRLLSTFGPRSRAAALLALRAKGVEVRLNTSVERATERAVHLTGGEVVPTHTLVWCAGIRASPLADALGLPQGGAGRVVVEADLSVAGHPEVFVVGDMAAATDPDGDLYPQVAPVAIQQARHAAAQILRRRQGQATERFRYRDKGTMATIGRHAAVAELPFGLRFRGAVAWVLWLGLHLIQLIGFRNRLQVLLDWSWNYLTYDRASRLILGPDGPDGPDGTRGRGGQVR